MAKLVAQGVRGTLGNWGTFYGDRDEESDRKDKYLLTKLFGGLLRFIPPINVPNVPHVYPRGSPAAWCTSSASGSAVSLGPMPYFS